MVVYTIDRVVKVVKELHNFDWTEDCPDLASPDFTKVSVSYGSSAKVLQIF